MDSHGWGGRTVPVSCSASEAWRRDMVLKFRNTSHSCFLRGEQSSQRRSGMRRARVSLQKLLEPGRRGREKSRPLVSRKEWPRRQYRAYRRRVGCEDGEKGDIREQWSTEEGWSGFSSVLGGAYSYTMNFWPSDPEEARTLFPRGRGGLERRARYARRARQRTCQ